MIKKESFGKLNDKDVFLYTLDNGCGLSAEITNYGGIIKSLVFNGTDVVLGRDNLEEYLQNDGYYGALIGRNSNRIANAEFELNGKKYELYKNDGNNNLHSGKIGFDAKVWDAEMFDDAEPSLVLTLHSPDGEEGFPGNADIKVTYTLTKENSIKIHYEGKCDEDTIMNLTNHSYFNLNGHDSGVIDGHTICLDCSFYTPNNDECMPTGEVIKVDGTAFDLRTPAKFGDVFNSNDEQVKMFGGFDHNFCLNGRGFRKIATLMGDKTGIEMETYTDQPGVQIYSGNMIIEDRVCKEGIIYKKHNAVCLETQVFPNAMANPHFPSPILKKDDKYDTITEYKFK